MPTPQPSPTPQIQEAEIVAVFPKERRVTIKYQSGVNRDNVVVINDPSSNSMPNKGDIGLILSAGNFDYYIGKVEYRYKEKVEGKSNPGRLKDAEGNDIYTKEVKPGEVLLINIAKGIELFLSRGGNFWLKHRNKDGMTYKVAQRMLEIAGTLITMSGAGVNVAIGRVMRNVKGLGLESIASDAGPLIPALEALIEVVAQQTIRVARLHLGHVKDPLNPTGMTDEIGIVGKPPGRLHAVLEAGMGPTKSAVKIDEFGNVEVAAAPTMEAALTGKFVNLGNFAATDFLVKGTTYTGIEKTFLGALSTLMDELFIYFTSMSGVVATPSPGAPFPTAATASTLLPKITAAKTAIEAFSNALNASLSTITKTI